MQDLEFQGSIQKRLVWIILLVASITSFFGYASFVYWYLNNQYEKTLELTKTIALVESQNFAKVLLLNELSTAADISAQLQSFSNVKSIVLYKKDGSAIYQYSRENRGFQVEKLPSKENRKVRVIDGSMRLYVDAYYLKNHLGYVAFNVDVKTLKDIILRDIDKLLFVYLLIVLLSFLLAQLFSRKFTKPILKLVDFLEVIDMKEPLKDRIFTKEKNEYGKLYAEVNTLLEKIYDYIEEQRIAATVFETQNGMVVTDAHQKIVKVNRAFTKITGYSEEEVLGKRPSLLKSGYQGEDFYDDMQETIKKHHYWSGEIYNKRKDGTIFPEFLTIQDVVDKEGNTLYYVASFVDITVQKSTEAKLKYLQQYDGLTGLGNRKLLLQHLEEYSFASVHKSYGALISFNVKDFKLVNSAYGHTNGDMILQEIAQRLKKNFDDAQFIARIGSDEFSLWFKDIDENRDKTTLTAKYIAEYIRQIISRPFSLNDIKEEKVSTLYILINIGIAIYDKDFSDPEAIIKETDAALNLSREHDTRITFFDKHSERIAQSALNSYAELLQAIENNELELYYQLQYNQDRVVVGAEALIRWNHPTQGLVYPDNFIPVAEKTGLILDMGRWIIHAACAQLSKWQKDVKSASWVMAVNISAKQFQQEDFVQQIEFAVNKYGIKHKFLKLELTESLLADDMEAIIKKMEELRALGIKISLDDFGTGYSSLQYLKTLPLDQVKIDQSFVRTMLDSKQDVVIIESIIKISHVMGFEVIAEGVETKEHYDFLQSIGCHFYQGYYFARPQSIAYINEMFKS